MVSHINAVYIGFIHPNSPSLPLIPPNASFSYLSVILMKNPNLRKSPQCSTNGRKWFRNSCLTEMHQVSVLLVRYPNLSSPSR